MHAGSCHCGAVKYTVDGEIGQVVECNCSHCQRKGFLLWFVPRTALQVTQGADKLTTYTFNKHVIHHDFCQVCGCQPFGLGKDPSGAEMAAINVRCLEGVDLDKFERMPVNGRDM